MLLAEGENPAGDGTGNQYPPYQPFFDDNPKLSPLSTEQAAELRPDLCKPRRSCIPPSAPNKRKPVLSTATRSQSHGPDQNAFFSAGL
jgi:hypothetical protein